MGILWEAQPAQEWLEAYPIGNGKQGAMVFGGIQSERVQLNLDSLWYGGPADRINPDAKRYLKQVQELILSGKPEEAEELLLMAFSAVPQSQRPYQPLGNLQIGTLTQLSAPAHYRRELDLSAALATECFEAAETQVRKTYFASFPDEVLVFHYEAEGRQRLSMRFMLERARFYETAGKLGDHAIYLKGQSGQGGVSFYTALSVVDTDGELLQIGEYLLVRDFTRLTLALAGETSFYRENPAEAVQERLRAAEAKGYRELLARHEADYRVLYERVEFKLGQEKGGTDAEDSAASAAGVQEDMPFHLRLQNHTEDPAVVECYFNYSRYLMIAGSRPGSLPLTLQGIWNEEMEPSWDSKYTININTEMNYWPAELLNLAECHAPLFDLLVRVCERGKETAQRMYGCRGSLAHHNVDIWADTAPQGVWLPAVYWVLGEAWLCTHIMRHYRMTGDVDFLQRMYHCLEQSVLFFEDFLLEDKGELVCCPTVSPENTYILPDGSTGRVSAGCTMDTEILNDLFADYLEASEILGIKNEITEQAERCREKFPPLKIGKHGQIMEWREDYEEWEPGHRHISQLYGLFPSTQISPEKTPELAAAAAKTLARRLAHGGGHTGWSCAWIICMYARLADSPHAYDMLLKLLRNSTADNLMDTHPRKGGVVFQIDGNMGAAAGIAAMLYQSEPGYLKLLPALPAQWASGSLRGVRLHGEAEMSLCWQDGKLQRCSIKTGRQALDLRVQIAGREQRVQIPAHAGVVLQ